MISAAGLLRWLTAHGRWNGLKGIADRPNLPLEFPSLSFIR